MERSHITQSDAPRQQNLTKQAIGACNYGTVPEKAIPYWQQRTADREWMLGRVAAYEKSKKQNRPAITYMPKKGVA